LHRRFVHADQGHDADGRGRRRDREAQGDHLGGQRDQRRLVHLHVALLWRLMDAVGSYDAIARVYDPWSRSVTEDVPFYLEEARRSGGPVVELGVGTGRIAVPIACDGIRVIGVDSSRGMLEVCAERAALAGAILELRLGDLREPPV